MLSPRFTVVLPICLAAMTLQADAKVVRFKSDVAAKEWSTTISGQLLGPRGAGPFPVVVFLHPCAGIRTAVRTALNAHARFLRKNGFATLILDSFSARRLNGGKACSGDLSFRAAVMMTDDAFNAMAALQKFSEVDADNIFLAGQSLGARAAVRAATRMFSRHEAAFGAVVAWYPYCGLLVRGVDLKSPLLVLGGAKDDWTPPNNCRHAKRRGRVTGADYQVVVYPKARHAFDQPRRTIRYKGHMLGYDPRATADGRRKMAEFFRAHMKSK